MSEPKTLGLSNALHAYLVAHGTPPDALQQAPIEETRERCGGWGRCRSRPSRARC